MKSINPAIKLVTLIGVTFVLAFKYNAVLNLAVFAACIVLILTSGANRKVLLGVMIPILIAAVGMFFTGYRFSADSALPVNLETLHIGSSAVWNGLGQASRVLAYAGVGLLFALTTEKIYMIKSFQRQFHVPQVFAYGLLAAWGIFPQMMQEFKRTRLAFRARGLSSIPVSPAVLKPMLVKTVRWSEALAVAMESKGFESGGERTEYQPIRVQPKDWAFLIVVMGAMLAAAWIL